jgi:hypothetical protein
MLRRLKMFIEALLRSSQTATTAVSFDPVFDSALLDVGMGEVPLGSNSGPYVESMRVRADLPQRGQGEWCALLWSVHSMENGIDIKHRGAPGIVRELGKVGRRIPRRKLSKELVEGFCGLVLHRRGGSNHHVRGIKVYRSDDGTLMVRWVGGNERHVVKTGVQTLSSYLPTILKASTL